MATMTSLRGVVDRASRNTSYACEQHLFWLSARLPAYVAPRAEGRPRSTGSWRGPACGSRGSLRGSPCTCRSGGSARYLQARSADLGAQPVDPRKNSPRGSRRSDPWTVTVGARPQESSARNQTLKSANCQLKVKSCRSRGRETASRRPKTPKHSPL